MLKVFFFLVICVIYSNSAQSQDTSKVEWIKVHFNMPADTSFALPGNESNSEVNLVHTLTTLIDSAKFSVDLCAYDIEHPDLAIALVAAKNRGLRVRVVTDNGNRTDGRELDVWFLDQLAKAGIYSIDDEGDIYKPDGTIEDNKKVNSGADMHHKFAVLDHLSPSKQDDIVWTGSTNLTWTGNFNTNTTLVIKDSDIAETYLTEFEIMWGGSSDLPNAEKARFHKDKPAMPERIAWVNDIKVEVYFSPLDRDKRKTLISDRIIQLIEKEAQHDIKFSAFSITPTFSVSKALWAVDSRNITLEGVIASDFYSRYRKQGAIWASEEARTGNRMILQSNELRKLHHKTILIDAESPDPNDVAITITGSYNFSTNADLNNDENLLVIYSNEIANQFLQDFKGIKARANGTAPLPIPDFSVDSLYKVEKISDPNRIELRVVPGFGFPVQIAGIRAPWSWRGNDSTTYFAEEAVQFLKRTLSKKMVTLKSKELNYQRGTLTGKLDFEGNDVGLMLIKEGMATTSFSRAITAADSRVYKQAEEEAKEKKKGMWKHPEKVGQVIPVPNKNNLEALTLNPININTAEIEDFRLLPGIGPSKATAIIEYRETFGLFISVMELTKVKGIGVKTVQKLLPYITVENVEDL